MVRLRGYQMGGQGLVPCLRSLHFGAWNPYDVPADRDVRLAVINGGGTVHSLVVNALCLARYYPSPETIGAKIIRHARRGYNPDEVRDIVLRELPAD